MIKERLISLDVFRGFTILLMTIVNNPGSWATVYPPLLHSDWNGCTPTDLVFPFFIFIMGVAVSFAMPTKNFDGATFNKIMVRSLRMFCLGVFFNFFGKIQLFGLEGIPLLIGRLIITIGVGYALMGSFNSKVKTYLAVTIFVVYLFLAYSGIEAYQDVRLPGVLQRIGIVYFIISLLYLKTTQKTQLIVASTILLGYWVIMTLISVHGIGLANLEKGTNLASWIDSILLKDHVWAVTKTWDPEGILSTIPAIASGIIGLLIGQLLNRPLPKLEIAKRMGIAGIILIILGLLWSIVFPLNKSLWTSSFVLYTSGLAIISLTLFYYVIDIENYKKWTKLFLVWGVNPMIVFFFSEIIPQGLEMIQFQNPEIPSEQINLQNYLYSFWIAPVFNNPMTASLAGALIYVTIWSLILGLFYKHKLIFKV
ncbi:acyltransferase family protein [Flavobacterium sp. GNP002]